MKTDKPDNYSPIIDKSATSLNTKTGEYISARLVEPTHPPIRSQRSLLRWMLSPFIWSGVIIIFVFVLLMFGRQWYDSLLVRWEQSKTVHPDQSIVTSGIRSQVRPTITFVYKNSAGETVRVIADAQEYSEFVNQQITDLTKAQTQLQNQIKKRLHDKLTTIFATMHERVERFANWYFAYPTTYKILWEATTSATQHALSMEATSLSEAVAYDVEKYLHQHYEHIVLHPEITDPQLRSAYNQTLQTAHDRYLQILSTTQTQFQTFVAKYTTHLETPIAENTQFILDWESQFNKINMAEYEKGPKGAALGAALTIGGASVGKAVASAAGSKAITGTASKSVFAKLATPFASKAVFAGTGGAVGTLGGPLGAALGAVGGLGIDYVLNEGVELTQRDTFTTDVHDALNTTQMEWQQQMLHSLQETIRIWSEDTIQLIPRYYQ